MIRRVTIIVLVVLLVAVGLLLSVLPGPAVLAYLVAIALLASEFPVVRRWMTGSAAWIRRQGLKRRNGRHRHHADRVAGWIDRGVRHAERYAPRTAPRTTPAGRRSKPPPAAGA